jgi:integrase
VQAFLNSQLRAGRSVRSVQIMRQVLSTALSRAVREELVTRNVGRLVELPTWEPGIVAPWAPAEALIFLSAASDDPLYPAFVLLPLYGMRRGEVLGLRWQDIEFDDQTIRIRQQIQRVQGQLQIGPVKTRAGSRDVPLIGLARIDLTAGRHSRRPTARTSAPPGLIPVSSSQPGRAGPSSRATSCAPSSASAITTRSERSACTPSATPLPYCSRITG